MKYSVVLNDDIVALVRPHFVELGILTYPVSRSRVQNGNRTEMDLTVRFINTEDADDYIDVESSGYGIDDGDKGAGKSCTYAIKYAIMKTLMIESGDDDPDLAQNTVHRADHDLSSGAISDMIITGSSMAVSTAELERFYRENQKLFDGLKASNAGAYDQVMRQMRVTKLALQEKESHAVQGTGPASG